MNNIPAVTAVILNYNRYEDTVQCIHSLQKCTYPKLNILLVDNGSPDKSGERLKEEFQSIVSMCLPRNTGYAAGNNAGIRYALDRGQNTCWSLIMM